MDFSLQAPPKGAEDAEHEDREARFHHINDQGMAHMKDGQPVLTVDTKKKLPHEVARRERARGLQDAGGAGFSGMGRRSRSPLKFVWPLGARWHPCGLLAASCDGMHPKSDHDPLYSMVVLGLLEASASEVTTLCSTEGVLLYVSAAVGPVLGWKPAQLTGLVADDFIHPAEKESVRMARAAALRTEETVMTTQRFLASNGRYLWTKSATRQIVDQRVPGGVVLLVSIRNIADRKLVEARLEREALADPLTGIANRTVLMDRLTQALRRLQRDRFVLAVIYLDLDRFKVINDSLGHKLGDQLLMKVAARAMTSLRPADTLARIGGDEFVIVAEGLADIAEAVALAVRICASIEKPFDLDGEAIVCTVSAGVTTTVDPGHGALALLQEADLALYRAKDRGRNRAEVFDEELRATAIGRLGTEQMVRRAIKEDGLRVQYQPIIDLTTGQVVAAEALVRIQGPGKLIMPDAFIDVAEESGLLVDIDEWVLRRAVEQAAAWQRELGPGHFGRIAINVTGRHLSDSRYARVLGNSLAEQGLPHGSMSIEVTERVLMEASNSAIEGQRAIRALGVNVGVDDFGTGYSSLAYLRQFPLDFVKIDQSFIRELGDRTEQSAIVTAIIGLAHALRLSVVAEGVETAEQLLILKRLGCDRGQGFLFSRAEDPESISSIIRERAALMPR
jgi:diguanylate cyclase (GGDEF)-like protein/PAS domain S-box-containing protein